MIDLDTALRLVGMRLGDRALIGPQVVQLDLTDACNNNCIGCWARSPFLRDDDHYDTLEKGALKLEFVERLLPRLVELRVKEIFLGGGGEPLCHPDALAVIEQAKKLGLAVTLNTNFTLVDQKTVEKLVDAGLDLLVVSLWAATGKTYSRLHPNKTEASFARLTERLRQLAEYKSKQANAGPRVKLYHVINSLNYEEIPAMIEHGRAVGAEELELSVFDPIPGRTNIFTLNRRQIDRVLKILESLDDDDKPFVHKKLFVRRLQNIDAAKGVFDNGIVGSIPCAAGWFYSRITTVGQVHGCLKAHRVAAGDLRQHDFRAVWFGEGMKTFRRHTVSLDYDDPWLKNIGHDIGFDLPGCYRVCDNLGHNQSIMMLAGALTDHENKALDAMERAAREGGELKAIEDAYRDHLPDEAQPAEPFSARVKVSREAGVELHGDNELVHGLAKDATPWKQALAALPELAAGETIRVPVTIHNVARLDRLLRLVRERTGRALDPAWAALKPRPLGDIHERWARQLTRAQELAAAQGVRLDLRDDRWRRALWRIAEARPREDEAELLRVLGALTGTAFLGPRTFHLDVTNKCEADCVYCWFHSPLAAARTDPHRLTDENRDAVMDWEMFTALADDLATLEAKEDVVLSGKGEPLAHPRILDMVRALKERELFVTLFTGGHRLDEKAARVCVEAQVDLLYVSLSAAGEDTFARLHTALSKKAYGRIVDNVRRLLKLRNEAGREKPRVILVDVITNRNDEEVEDFARLAAELGVDHLRYQLAAIETYNQELAVPADRLTRLRRSLGRARKIAAAAGVEVVENIDLQLEKYAEGSDWSADHYREVGCLAGFVFGRAWADGNLSFCCAPRPIGNLRERSFAAWWRSDEYDRARLAARSMSHHADYRFADGTTLWTDVCRRCPNYEGIERLRRVMKELDLLDLLP